MKAKHLGGELDSLTPGTILAQAFSRPPLKKKENIEGKP